MGSHTGPAVLQGLRRCCPEAVIWGLDARSEAAGLHLCDRGRRVPWAADGLGEDLLAWVEREGIEVLIPALDVELPVLAPLAEAFARRGCHLLAGGEAFVATCRSKAASAAFFRARGLPFAATIRAMDVMDPVELPYPLLVKPEGGSGSKGQRLVPSAEAWGAGLAPGEVAQPLLRAAGAAGDPGPWVQPELTAQTVHGPDGALAGLMVGRTWKAGGLTQRLEVLRDPEVEACFRSMAEALVPLGLRGPCNLQGILTEAGPVCFEVNPRFTGGTALRTELGFREVEAALRLLVAREPLSGVAEALRVEACGTAVVRPSH